LPVAKQKTSPGAVQLLKKLAWGYTTKERVSFCTGHSMAMLLFPSKRQTESTVVLTKLYSLPYISFSEPKLTK